MCRTWYGFAVVHARAGADWQPEGFADLGARRPGLAIAWVEPDPHALGLGQGPLGLQGGACSRAFFCAMCGKSLGRALETSGCVSDRLSRCKRKKGREERPGNASSHGVQRASPGFGVSVPLLLGMRPANPS